MTIDVVALTTERLIRAQECMRAAGLAAALLFDPANVRYVTCDGQHLVFNQHCWYRWALVLADDEPVLWEGSDEKHVSRSRWGGEIRDASGFSYFGSGPNRGRDARSAIAEVVSELRVRELQHEPLGVDRAEAIAFLELAAQGVHVVDAAPVFETARAVKTPLELAVHRDNARLADDAVRAFLPGLTPGKTENELWGELARETFARGALHAEARLLCSGPRTNPWMQEAGHRVVENGDLVAFDTDLVGPHGYLTDISRTYLCGDRPATKEQREVYRAAYTFVHESLPEFLPGRSFVELGEKLGARMSDQYVEQRYPFIAHGCGAVDEYPVVRLGDNHPGVLEPGMVISVEGYMGAIGGTVGAKYEEQIIITDGAPELISHAPVDDRLLDEPLR
ncbi:Xaa-Pro peptidase family protein [Nocardioides hungaricus]